MYLLRKEEETVRHSEEHASARRSSQDKACPHDRLA